MHKALRQLFALATLALPVAVNATTYTFNAGLSGANEIPGSGSTATGSAILSYNDFDTLSMADDTYTVSMTVTGLLGTPTGFHIHGAATAAENAPVRVALDGSFPPFVSGFSGGTLVVGGTATGASIIGGTGDGGYMVPATPVSGTNAGYPSMSFLSMLTSGLAYVNVHSTFKPSGEVRGQLLQVAVVPEPETFGMLLAGLALIGVIVGRRKTSV